MEQTVLTILSQAGTSGIVALIVIAYMYFDSKKKSQSLIVKDDQRSDKTEDVAFELKKENEKENERLYRVEFMFQEHCKTQTEAFATIHNGLNTQANAIKDLSKILSENTKELAVINKTIELTIKK